MRERETHTPRWMRHLVFASKPHHLHGMAVLYTPHAEFKDIALPIINAAFQDLTLPGMDLQEHVPVLGHITLDLR